MTLHNWTITIKNALSLVKMNFSIGLSVIGRRWQKNLEEHYRILLDNALQRKNST